MQRVTFLCPSCNRHFERFIDDERLEGIKQDGYRSYCDLTDELIVATVTDTVEDNEESISKQVGETIELIQETQDLVDDLWLRAEIGTPLYNALDNARDSLLSALKNLWSHQDV